MANRVEDYGMDVAITRRLNSRYDPQAEAEVLAWIQALTSQRINPGRESVQLALRDGQILMNLIIAVYNGTPNLPPNAQRVGNIKPNIKTNTAFKHMENINKFLNLCEAYGVPRTSLFQTVDLYESRNMAQVVNTILQLGTECQRNGFNGPVIGPKPTSSNRRQFSEQQMRSGEGVVCLQSGTNQFASQKGMSMGNQRHVADIKCNDMTQEGSGVIGLQMGTNQFASQKGMSFGATRHIADIRCDDMTREGQSVIGLQMGTNQHASQKGMRMGASRHVADIKVDAATPEGQAIINLQYGTNQVASQAGMRIGAIRHITDVKCDGDYNAASSNQIGLQMGPGQNQVASQSGMSFGAQRHIVDSH